MPIRDRSLIDNQYLFGRSANGPPTFSARSLSAAHPVMAGLGMGVSVVKHDGTTAGRLVSNDNYSGDGVTAVHVSGLTLDGNLPVPNFPYNNSSQSLAEQALAGGAIGNTLVADGIDPNAAIISIAGCEVKNFRGVGIQSHHTNNQQLGRMHTVHDCLIHHCWTGWRAPSSDRFLAHSVISNVRDYGIHVAASSGNVQSIGNHAYGARIACYNEGGQGFRGTQDTYADSAFGYWGGVNGSGSWGSQLSNCMVQHNWTRGIVLFSGAHSLVNCSINVMRETTAAAQPSFLGIVFTNCVGIDVRNERCEVLGGSLLLTNYVGGGVATGNAAEGIWINGNAADLCRIETVITDFDGVDGTIGIRVKGAPGGVTIDCLISGFGQTNERLLVVEDAGIRDFNATFRVAADLASDVNKRDLATSAGLWVDLPANWKPAGSNNSVTLINTTTGEVVALTNQAY